MSTKVTIEVNREDVQEVYDALTNSNPIYGRVVSAMRRIHACLPEPEWEPDPELTRAFRKIMWPRDKDTSYDDYLDPTAAIYLKRLRDAGIEVEYCPKEHGPTVEGNKILEDLENAYNTYVANSRGQDVKTRSKVAIELHSALRKINRRIAELDNTDCPNELWKRGKRRSKEIEMILARDGFGIASVEDLPKVRDLRVIDPLVKGFAAKEASGLSTLAPVVPLVPQNVANCGCPGCKDSGK